MANPYTVKLIVFSLKKGMLFLSSKDSFVKQIKLENAACTFFYWVPNGEEKYGHFHVCVSLSNSPHRQDMQYAYLTYKCTIFQANMPTG